MAEYIERSVVLLQQTTMTEYDEGGWDAPVRVVRVADIEAIPAADVAPVVHGRWKYYHKQNKAVCTNCSFERDLDANFGKAISCPNCWAKMDAPGINVGG